MIAVGERVFDFLRDPLLDPLMVGMCAAFDRAITETEAAEIFFSMIDQRNRAQSICHRIDPDSVPMLRNPENRRRGTRLEERESK
jgi:hypothetical protein